MSKKLLTALLPATLLTLTGCIDSNYDLDNMDKTVGLSVNNLVVPVNLGPITLNDVIEIDEEDPDRAIFKEEINGKEVYLVKKGGDFSSDEIHISTFHVNPPTDMEPTETEAHLDMLDAPAARSRRVAGLTASYSLKPMTKQFTYNVANVDKKVKTVDVIESKDGLKFTMIMKIPANLFNKMNSVELKGMSLTFPSHLEMADGSPAHVTIDGNASNAKYDPATGVILIPSHMAKTPEVKLEVTAQVINVNEMDGMKLTDGKFTFDGQIVVNKGQVVFNHPDNVDLPRVFTFVGDYEFSSFDIDYFTGKIDYDIEGLDFDPISLADLPDFLSGEQTKIKIANPQVYLDVDNTCAPYKLGGRVCLTLTANRPTGSIEYPMSEPIIIKDVVDNIFAISPEGKDLQPVHGYNVPKENRLEFKGLSDILFGSEEKGFGIPNTVDVSFVNPVMDGTATRFPLRQNEYDQEGTISAITGSYEFIAPLALDKGSLIYYVGKKDNFDSDELKALELNLVEVTAEATSDLPLAVTLEGFLRDSKGDKIGRCTKSFLLKENAQNETVTIVVEPKEGEEWLTDIDGIDYMATAVQDVQYAGPLSVPALSPDMKIELKNLRLKVNGRWIKDLDD